jgi:hypothetical protein
MKRRLWLLLAHTVLGLLGLAMAAEAYAQAGTAGSVLVDSTSVTVGSAIILGTEYGYTAGSFGSISTTTTSDNYTYVSFFDDVRSGKVGGYFDTQLTVKGFSADPGVGWLVTAVAGSVTFDGSSAHAYSYSSGQSTWTWQTGPAFVGQASNPVSVTITHGAQVADLNVKFKILGVDYAPPGAKSTVSYTNSTMRGSSTSDSQTYTSSVTVGVKVKEGASILGLVGGSLTEGVSQTWSQENDTSSSVAFNATATNSDVVPGPASSTVGIDHDYDIIWVWLNPMVTLAVGPNTVVNTGLAYNAADDAAEMEVVPLYATWLKNPSTIPASVAARLARSWDTSGVGGLTTEDYQIILAADPFEASSTYDPNADAGHRFDLQEGQTFNYEPPPAGGQPLTETLTLLTNTVSTAGQGATNGTSTTYSLDFDSGADVVASLEFDVSFANTYTTSDKWNATTTTGSTQTASLSLVGPQATDNYTGPTGIQVWRDNIYGSFMFYPVE